MTQATGHLPIKNILYGIAILTAIGLLLYFLHKRKIVHIPSSVEIGKSGPTLAFLVALYFIIGFLILFFFFKPKGVSETLGVAGTAVLWNIY